MYKKIAYILLFALCGCMSNASNTQPNKVVGDFYTKYLSPSERMSHFKNYSLEEQYEIFEFGNRVIHPPATYLDLPFAQQGPTIIPFLKVKLDATKDEATIRDIMLIFSKVAQLKLYNFSKDTELMNLLNQKVNGMQGIWKDITTKFLAEIQSGELAQ